MPNGANQSCSPVADVVPVPSITDFDHRKAIMTISLVISVMNAQFLALHSASVRKLFNGFVASMELKRDAWIEAAVKLVVKFFKFITGYISKYKTKYKDKEPFLKTNM
ncbi:hypothetical protein TSUD_160340 [Trifolium subterraneum]|nr:hypothetical protein TSUD_160340 [Trifolium subterraneum]